MADIRNFPEGAIPKSLEQINEIIRGATIRAVRVETVPDPDHGGECVMIELNGGDRVIFVAIPASLLDINPEYTARIQALLIHRRHTRLHV